LPRWHQLTTEIRQPVIALLTRMLHQHLPGPSVTDAKEVSDESR